MLAALKADAKRRGVKVKSPEMLVDFIIHGQINLMASDDMPNEATLALIREYVEVLIASQTVEGDSRPIEAAL